MEGSIDVLHDKFASSLEEARKRYQRATETIERLLTEIHRIQEELSYNSVVQLEEMES